MVGRERKERDPTPTYSHYHYVTLWRPCICLMTYFYDASSHRFFSHHTLTALRAISTRCSFGSFSARDRPNESWCKGDLWI